MKIRNYLNQLNPAIYGSVIVMMILSSCFNDKSPGSDGDVLSTEKQDTERKRVQLFWDNYREAQKYKALRNWGKASEYYLKALEINASHEDALFNLGNMYLEMNDYHNAKQCWQNIIKSNANSARARMQLGRLYLSPERPEVFNLDSAKLELTLALKINRIITGPLMLLGHIALIEGDYLKANEYFSAVIGSDIKNVEAYYLLGYLAWKSRDIQQSNIFLEKAIENQQLDKSNGKELSEGDTRDGISYLRPINVSLFYPFIQELERIKSEDQKGDEFKKNQYHKLDSLLFQYKGVSDRNNYAN